MSHNRDERAARFIEIIEPKPEDCPVLSLPEDGNVQFKYRLMNENLQNPSDPKAKLVPRFDVSAISPPRSKILELLRPEDPGRDALEAIVRPVPRRGLSRPLDEDTRRFLQRALQSPNYITIGSQSKHEPAKTEQKSESAPISIKSKAERSLADELREAEEDDLSGGRMRRELLLEFRRRGGGVREAVERDQLGKLALSVEEDELEDGGLCAAARRIDALLAESRDLHEELAGIQEDLQAQSARACRCTAAARALSAESLALRFLDDVVALLRGDVASANRTRDWPFAIGRRQPGRNYII